MKFFIVALFACIAVASASGIIGAPLLAPATIIGTPAIATTGYTTGLGCAGLGCGLGVGKLGLASPAYISSPALIGTSKLGLASPAYIGSPALIGAPIGGYSTGLIGGKTIIG